MAAPTVLTPSYGRIFFAINAVLAGWGLAISFTLNASGYYVSRINPDKPHLLGNVAGGVDTFWERLFDWITYFTIWSNTTVAIVLTALTLRPTLLARTDRTGAIWRVLRMDSLLMIMITGIVYNLLLTEGGKSGWDLVSNTLIHVIVPIVTPVVWIIAGPRGAINLKTILLALILPIILAVFALTRGVILNAYPYPFLNVEANGWVSVLSFIAVIVVVAIVIGLILWAIDRALLRTMRRAD